MFFIAEHGMILSSLKAKEVFLMMSIGYLTVAVLYVLTFAAVLGGYAWENR
jgi:hypothetical protein